jgi:hypothetical protein
MIDLLRYLVPVAHEALQIENLDQLDSLQSTLQTCVLQLADALLAQQNLPPFLAGVITDRVLILEPPPHSLEQAP